MTIKNLYKKYQLPLFIIATAAVILGIFRVQFWGWKCLLVMFLALIGTRKDQKDISWRQFLPAGFLTLLVLYVIYKYAGGIWQAVVGWQTKDIHHIFQWNQLFNSIPFNDGHLFRYWQPHWLTAYFSWVYMNGFTLSYWICVLRAFFTKDVKKFALYALAGYLLQVPLILPFYNTILLQEVWYVQGTPDILHRMMTPAQAYSTTMNCFPSMHTSIAFAAILLSRREKSKWFRTVILIYCVSIIVSTQYLKVHWMIDVLAGMLFAWINVKLATWIVNAKFFQKFARRFENITGWNKGSGALQVAATKPAEPENLK